MVSLIQHNQPVLLDGDFDSSLRMVHRLSDSWSVQAEAIPGFGFALLPIFDWDKISTASIPPLLPLLATSRRTLRGADRKVLCECSFISERFLTTF